jgi:putative oxidoreductase
VKKYVAPAYAEYGPFFIRFLVGFHLFYGNWGRVIRHKDWLDLNGLLVRNHFPFPTAATWISAGAQAACGILFMLGLFTRPAAAIMVINFVAALTMVHWGQAYPRQFAALAMLCTSIFLLLHGPGKLALDNLLRRR